MNKKWFFWLIPLAVVVVAGIFSFGSYLGYRAFSELSQKGCLALDFQPVVQPKTHNPQATHLILVGDSGDNNPNQASIGKAIKRYCQTEICDFGLLLGDNVYEHAVASIADPFDQIEYVFRNLSGLGFPFYVVLGNHDVNLNIEAQKFYGLLDPNWIMPNYSYQIETPNAHFYGLNTNCGLFDLTSLEKALTPNDKTWQIAFGHHPVYGSYGHGSTDFAQSWYWEKFLADRFQFYLSGHIHTQEYLTDSNRPLHYLITGGSSSLIEDVPKNTPKDIPAHIEQAFFQNTFGFVWLALSQDKAVFRYIDQAGKVLYEKSVPRIEKPVNNS